MRFFFSFPFSVTLINSVNPLRGDRSVLLRPLSSKLVNFVKPAKGDRFAISRPIVQSPLRQGRPTTCKTFETRAEADRLFDFHPDAVTKAMTRACKKAGLRDLHFHDLRHEATSRLFENTALDLMEIRSITGHKTLQMLARYSHLRMDRLADRLAGARRGESPPAS